MQRWCVAFRRRQDAPTLPQRDALDAWEASIRASGLPYVAASSGGSRPKLSFGIPVGGGLEARRDLVEFTLTQRLPVWRVREALGRALPPGHDLVDLHDVWLGEPALPARVVAAEYEARLLPNTDVAQVQAAVGQLLAAESLPRARERGDRTTSYDLRPFVIAAQLVENDERSVLRFSLRHDPERGLGRYEEFLAELASRAGDPGVEAVVRMRLVLATPEIRSDMARVPARQWVRASARR